MSRITIAVFSLLLPVCFSVNALAHPHDNTNSVKKSSTTSTSSLDAYFEKHAKSLKDSMRKIENRETKTSNLRTDETSSKTTGRRIDIIEDPESLRAAAKDIQNMLADSGFLENIADMVIDLAEDIDIVETENGMSLSFDGDRLGAINKTDKDGLSIETFGKNTTIEKESFVENGRKKTRIIIETDADNDVEYDIVPKPKARKNGF